MATLYSSPSSLSGIVSVPDDLVMEILLRLPVKSVLRFTCVSKSWNLLISSDEFYEKHRVVSKSRNTLNSTLMFRDKSTHKRKYYAISDDDDDAAAKSATLLETTRASPPYSHCLASGDGLLLFAKDTKHLNKNLILWNPCTRKFKRLPKFVQDKYVSQGQFAYCNYGLGFDESSKQFKVIGFLYTHMTTYNPMVKIYGLGENVPWRRIKNHTGFTLFNCYYYGGMSTLCANGKIHWIVRPTEHNEKYLRIWEIAYLDLETEEYGILHKPEFVPGNCQFPSLAFSQGVLYACCQHNCFRPADDGYADVWMIEPVYGKFDKSTWTRVVRVPLIHHRKMCLGFTMLVHVWSDGPQLLLSCGTKFVIFNKKDSSLITYPDMERSSYKHFTYVESLISP